MRSYILPGRLVLMVITVSIVSLPTAVTVSSVSAALFAGLVAFDFVSAVILKLLFDLHHRIYFCAA